MMSLNEWIRAQPGLTGTKKMCTEGGCGCCIVSATFTDLTTQKRKTIAINSVYNSCALGCSSIFPHTWQDEINIYLPQFNLKRKCQFNRVWVT